MSLQVKAILRKSTSKKNEINVLPFYSFSFEQLNNGKEYKANYDYNSNFRALTAELISKSKITTPPHYFYDVRNWEDYSCAAPEYMLLDELNWHSTKPLAFTIKDQIDLYLVFEHMEVSMLNNTCACVAITLQNDEAQYDEIILFINKNSTDETCILTFQDFISPLGNNEFNAKVSSIVELLFHCEDQCGFIEFQNPNMTARIKYEKGDSNALLQFS